MKLPCAVTRDLLTLYAENMVEQETKALVEEHLDECAECRKRLSEMNTSPGVPVDTIKPLQDLKKQIRMKRLYAAALASLCVFVGVFTYFFRTTAIQLIPWQDGLIEVARIEAYPSEDIGADGHETESGGSAAPSPTVAPEHTKYDKALVLNVNSIVNGFQEHIVIDDDGTETLYIQALSTNHRGGDLSQSYYESTILPAPDRMVYGLRQPQQLLWGTPMNGCVEILPRLALGYYLIIAAACAALCGSVWAIFRKWRYSWVLRQLFFAAVAYILSHLLLKGFSTTSFFMERDFISILAVAAALFALLSLAWRAFLQRRTER